MRRCRVQPGTIALVLMAFAASALTAQQLSRAEVRAGSVAAGAALFSGTQHFVQGGPACIACHSAGGLSFPNGGTLGPDLTHAYTRMGAEGIDSALTTLYFPAMYPLYKTRPLTAQERADVAAFLQYSSTQASPATTPAVAGLGIVLFVIFMLIIGFAGRSRVLGVRQKLVAQARRQVAIHAGPPPLPPVEDAPQSVRGAGESH